MLNQANIVLSHGNHRGIKSYVDYLLDILNSLYQSVTIGDAYRADYHNYLLDGNIPNEYEEIRNLSSSGVVIIFVATEWTKLFKNTLYFDTFHNRDLAASVLLRSLPKKYRGLLTNLLFLNVLDRCFDIQLDLLYFYVNRAEEFERNFHYFTAVIGPCEDLIEPYKHFGVPVFAIEPFFEESKFPKNNLDGPSKIFFSGKFTKCRQTVLANMQKAHPSLDIQYVENSTDLQDRTFTHEMYIPQQFKWPYGSPIRTYRSYRQGFIPVDFARYTQNTIHSYLPVLSDSPDSYDAFISYDIERLIEGAKASNAIREEQIQTYRDYLIAQDAPSQKKYYKSNSMDSLKLVAENYKGFNILELEEQYYGIPEGEGKFSLQHFDKQNYSVSFMGESEASVRQQITQSNPKLSTQIKEIRQDYQGFNILELNQQYYGIPQGEGKFSFQRIEKQDYSACFIGESEASVCRQITEYNPKLSAQIKEIRQSYQGFNILKLNQQYYGIPQGEGEFSFQRIEKQDYSACFIGESEASVCRQITKYTPASPGQIKEIRQGYQGFNILKLNQQYYGIPQGEGEFSTQRIEKQKDYSACFIGESEESVCRQITEYKAKSDRRSRLYLGINKIKSTIKSYLKKLIALFFKSE